MQKCGDDAAFRHTVPVSLCAGYTGHSISGQNIFRTLIPPLPGLNPCQVVFHFQKTVI